MQTTKLSSKGQVIIPKALRNARHWRSGLELLVVDTGEGLLLKPKAPFTTTQLADVAGMFRHKVVAKTDTQIQAALIKDIRRKWRDSN